MTWVGLRYKSLEPVLPEEWNLVIRALDELHERTSTLERYMEEIDPAKLSDIYNILLKLEERKRIRTLGYVIQRYVLANTDVFDSDLTVEHEGRVRIKLMADRAIYALLKWVPKEALEPLIAYLNSRVELPASSWFEFDFTVRDGDKVNVRVIPEANVTVFIFNIGET